MKIFFTISLMVCVANAKVFYPATYKSIGCWRDTENRAIPFQEGKGLLTGPSIGRDDAIQLCARTAAMRGFEVFAVQYGGQCSSSFKARYTYMKYGRSNDCKPDGRGGSYANQVYEVASYGKVFTRGLGCWKDTAKRAIQPLEGLEMVLDGHYKTRKEALKKCVAAAFARGYKVIALQDGGWCAGMRNARYTYRQYGPSNTCDRTTGKGGPWGNQVYELIYSQVRYFDK